METIYHLKINRFSVDIETIDEMRCNWIFIDIGQKNFEELFKIGDVIYSQKIKSNKYNLKQLPKEWSYSCYDPLEEYFLSGGFGFKNSEFNRATRH